MSAISLYDKLIGCFASQKDPSSVDLKKPLAFFAKNEEGEPIDPEILLRDSIVENIKLILQSRRGAITHLPTFGLPDFRKIYLERGFDVPVRLMICQLIKETLLTYEPRIEDIEIIPKHFDPENLRLTLEIEATVIGKHGKELLLTEFSSEGWLKVIDKEDVGKQGYMGDKNE